jgi:hypothetical protein
MMMMMMMTMMTTTSYMLFFLGTVLRHLEMGGQPMVRARGFYLYLNDEWTEDEGGIFYDEEDDERDHVPQFNTLVHHRVPRWHSISPIRTKKSLICIYGWVVQKRLSNLERTQAMARSVSSGRLLQTLLHRPDAASFQGLPPKKEILAHIIRS